MWQRAPASWQSTLSLDRPPVNCTLASFVCWLAASSAAGAPLRPPPRRSDGVPLARSTWRQITKMPENKRNGMSKASRRGKGEGKEDHSNSSDSVHPCRRAVPADKTPSRTRNRSRMEPSGATFDDPEELHDLIYEVQGEPPHYTPRRNRERSRSTRAAALSSAPVDSSTDAPQNAGYSFRQVFLLMFLSAIVAALVMKLNTMENSVEVRQATTIREAHHRLPKAKVQNGPEKQEKSEAHKSTVWQTKKRKEDRIKDPKSTEDSPKAEKDADTAENATKNDQTDTHDHSYIGFHSPSMENMYGPNHYYKPKGVGFQHRPTGGNHPIYVMESAQSSSLDVYYSFDDDPETSPYTDLRLQMTDEERNTEQSEWSEMLDGIREKYGSWDFSDEYVSKNKKPRPFVDWEGFEDYKRSTLGEISSGDFPKDSWQTDDVYVKNFISEAQALVTRVQTAIRDEYGLSEDQIKVSILPTTDDRSPQGGKNGSGEGIAWMYQAAFDALVKKLLNAMITNDHFFMVLGGHSAAAGHGNNFHQK